MNLEPQNIDVFIYTRSWVKTDFVICLKSLFEESRDLKRFFFITEGQTQRSILNYIKKLSVQKEIFVFTQKEDLKKEEFKNQTLSDFVLEIKRPTLFYAKWIDQLAGAVNQLGNQFHYVPSFVNQLGEQASVLHKVYPHCLLFDLDYKRDKMKKNNIDYFNTFCALQFKEVEKKDPWITLYTDSQQSDKKTLCVLSCAIAKLQR